MKILFFDDSISNRENALEGAEMAGVECQVYGKLKDAMDAIDTMRPDIVTTDWTIEDDPENENARALVIYAISRGIPVYIRSELSSKKYREFTESLILELKSSCNMFKWPERFDDGKLENFPKDEIRFFEQLQTSIERRK